MLRFFRLVRRKYIEQGATRRYLFYAIGEILLVVIGILIALQVNNWNEERKADKERLQILAGIRADLAQDINRYDAIIELLEERHKNAIFLLELMRSPSPQIDSAETVSKIIKIGWILDSEPVLATYNEIQGSGKLSYINSAEIKNNLAKYKSEIIAHRMVFASSNNFVKEYEKQAIGFLTPVPVVQYDSVATKESNSSIEFSLQEMAQDRDFVNMLKHIIFNSQVEIEYKRALILPKAKALIAIVDKEIDAAK